MEQELAYFKERLSENSDLSSEEIHNIAMKMINKRWKNVDNVWKPRPGIVAELSKEDYFNLEIKRPSMPNKPDFSVQQERAVADFRGYEHSFSLIGNMEIIDEAQVPSQLEYIKSGKSDFKNARPSDYVLLKSVLCTSLPFVNANGDAFDADDLVEAVNSGQLDRYQPAIIDWRHDFQVYGTTIGAEIVDTKVEVEGFGKHNVKQVIVYSVFHAWLFPDRAEKLRKWAKKGILTFSMACGAEAVDWRNNGAVRVLKKPHFVANSIIPPDSEPADQNAQLIKIAQKEKDIPVVYANYAQIPEGVACAWYVNNEESVINTGEDMDYAKQIEELQKQVEDLTKANEDLIKKNQELEKTEAAKKIEELTKSIEDLSKKVEELEKASENHEADMSAKQTDLDAANEALNKANEQLKELRSKEVDRINEERKDAIAKVVGDDEEKVEFWFDKYQASVTDEGEIVDPKDEFEAVMANIPTVPEKELTDEEKAALEKEKAEKAKEPKESEKTKRSKENLNVATKTSNEEEGLLDDVMSKE
jgi:hypothetical protein